MEVSPSKALCSLSGQELNTSQIPKVDVTPTPPFQPTLKFCSLKSEEKKDSVRKKKDSYQSPQWTADVENELAMEAEVCNKGKPWNSTAVSE